MISKPVKIAIFSAIFILGSLGTGFLGGLLKDPVLGRGFSNVTETASPTFTNATSTGFFSTLIGFTSATGTNVSSTASFSTYGTVTNLSWTNATGTNTTSTGLFGTALGFTNTSGTNVSSTATFSSIGTITNVTSTGSFDTLVGFTNATGVNVTSTALHVSNFATFKGVVSSTNSEVIFNGLVANNITDNFVCQTATGTLRTEAASCTVSSIRFKEHVESLDSVSLLGEVRKLRAVSFDYKSPESHGLLGTQADQGFIAEEVALIDPYLVSWEEASLSDLELIRQLYPFVPRRKNGVWLLPHAVAYDKISVLLTGAIQAEDERITKLENRLSLYERFNEWIESLFIKK